jgi:hypothetical protein
MQNASRVAGFWRVSFRACVLGAVLLAVGIGELARFPDFVQLVKAYHLVPGWLIPITAILLISLESAVGLSLFVPPLRQAGALAAILLLSLFLALAAHARINGIEVTCGSFMIFQDRDISTLVIVQNLALLALSFVVYRDHRKREELPQPALP